MFSKLNQMAKRILGPKFYRNVRLGVDLLYPHRRLSYSQFGEDQFLLQAFRAQERGFFVDVGAFHPRQFSNTYALYRRGWSGVNVDATPGSMRLFRLLRPRDRNLEAAISDQPETIEFASWGHHAENTAAPDQVSGVTRDLGQPLEKITLRTQTLTEILDGLPRPVPPIDLLSVDVEGMDLKVLRSLDWHRYSPRIVIAELFVERIEDVLASELHAFLKEQGYRLASWHRPSLIFEKAR